MEFNTQFRKYLEEAIGQDNADIAFSAFDAPASVSVRRNPWKKAASFPYEGSPVPWSEYGMMLEERPQFTLDPLFHAGVYYVQDSSSMYVGHVFRHLLENFSSGRLSGHVSLPEGRPLRVLDLCAAPGGKTTDLAASLRACCGDNFLLVANEVMKQRVNVLADNVALWGDPNVIVTSDDPSAFAKLEGFFDIVVADVPCSGEGMFRKDEEAVAQWSEENVALCQARQRRIAGDVWPALAEEGFMVYSTCTFNRYENDLNVQWIADGLGADCISDKLGCSLEHGVIKTSSGFSLVPGLIPGEGQYCAVLQKKVHSTVFRYKAKIRKVSVNRQYQDLFQAPVDWDVKGGLLIALPSNIAAEAAPVLEFLHPVLSGCAVGTMKGSLLVPSSDLALSCLYAPDAYPQVEVSFDTALAYLHRDALVLPEAPCGYVVLTYRNCALGFVKNLGNRCNNLHPQSRRIRMNIK